MGGRDLVSAEASNIDLGNEGRNEKDDEKKEDNGADGLSEVDAEALCTYLKDTLGNKKVRDVKITRRLADSPCIITDHDSASIRRMMKMIEQGNSGKVASM